MIFEDLKEHLKLTKEYLRNYSETLVFEKPTFSNAFLSRTDVSAPGLYKIDINVDLFTKDRANWKNEFIIFWDDHKGQNRRTPSSKKKRLKKHPDIIQDDWVPLYIGRSFDVKNRIDLHINTPFEIAYQALKFKARGIEIDENLRISFCKLDKEYYEITSLDAEDYFRERYNPIVGNKG